jgi:hypothetical protein
MMVGVGAADLPSDGEVDEPTWTDGRVKAKRATVKAGPLKSYTWIESLTISRVSDGHIFYVVLPHLQLKRNPFIASKSFEATEYRSLNL